MTAATATDFCRTYRHRLFGWPAHLARLRRDCAALGIPLPHTDADLTAAADRLVAHNAAGLGPDDDLALVTFATPGTLGYMLEDSGDEPRRSSTTGMHTFRLPKERYRRFFADGVTLAVAGFQPDGPFPIVPPTVKHRSRLNWWLAQRAVADPDSPFHCPGAVPALMNSHGCAIDTPIGAVFAVAGDTLIRPDRGMVLDSVTAAQVEKLAGPLGLRIHAATLEFGRLARPLTPDDRGTVIERVSEMLLVGTAFGVAGVRAFACGDRRREFAWPGPVFRRLLTAWTELTGVDVERQFLGEKGASNARVDL